MVWSPPPRFVSTAFPPSGFVAFVCSIEYLLFFCSRLACSASCRANVALSFSGDCAGYRVQTLFLPVNFDCLLNFSNGQYYITCFTDSNSDSAHSAPFSPHPRLFLKGYSGTAGRQSSLVLHGASFSTKDLDHDNCICKCAQMLTGGKRVTSCFFV